ncbi:MAG TPA: PASTA domain-containing protein [Phycisphaerae bacterium]|nr:PASTA domain-containing protein [Phycisphaerae bacterium]
MYANQVSPPVLAGYCLALIATIATGVAHAADPLLTTTCAQQSTTPIYWGTLWYLRGTSAFDNSTMVEGGAVGSAALVRLHPTQGCTDWILIEGQSLFLRKPGESAETVAQMLSDTHGNQFAPVVRSRAGGTHEPSATADQYEVTCHLVDVYKRTYWTPTPALHAPFLVGRGWDRDIGAWAQEAANILRSLDLRWQFLPAGTTTGHVIKQDPPGGRPLSKNSVITLTLDGVAHDEPSTVIGRLRTPLILTERQRDQDLAVDITLDHRDDLQGTCRSAGPEYCIKLPASAAGATVVVRQSTDYSDNLALSAWDMGGRVPVELKTSAGEVACDSGTAPEIRFTASRTFERGTYVVVELRDRNVGRVHIHIAWQP